MTNLEKLYQSIATFKELGLALNEDMLQKADSLEEDHRYEPDFVVETEHEIVMIEVKPQAEIDTQSVQAKKQTADKYCEIVNRNIGKYGIEKPWRYVILATDRITVRSTVEGLLSR